MKIFGKKTNKRQDDHESGGKHSIAKKLMVVNIVIAFSLTLYFFIVFTDLPYIGVARDLWIETAMTTAEHQWLATRFFPGWLIEKVMANQVVTDEDTISNPDLLRQAERRAGAGHTAVGAEPAGGAADGPYGAQAGGGGSGADSAGGAQVAAGANWGAPWNPVKLPADAAGGQSGAAAAPAQSGGVNMFGEGSFYETDFLTAANYVPRQKAGDKDEFGNTYLVIDEKEDIKIVEVKKGNYVGRIMIIPDPSRVVVRQTRKKNVQGEFIKTYIKEYDAIAGMNGNGFEDPEGHGRGGTITGWSVADGNAWGIGSKSEYPSVGLTEDDILLVGTIKDFNKYKIRDLAQYGPTIIVDGKKLISGSGGYGVQPRSAIGQREDGAILMATFDGRQPGHSLGITAGEVADVFLQYGCLNAGLCDGGSSSIMMYNDGVVGRPSTPMKDTGRYLPNAILVLRKQSPEANAVNEVAEAAAEPHNAQPS